MDLFQFNLTPESFDKYYYRERNLARHHPISALFGCDKGIGRRQFIHRAAFTVVALFALKTLAISAPGLPIEARNAIEAALPALLILVLLFQFNGQRMRLHNMGVSRWLLLVPWVFAAVAVGVDSLFGGVVSDVTMELANTLAFAYVAILLITPSKRESAVVRQRLRH